MPPFSHSPIPQFSNSPITRFILVLLIACGACKTPPPSAERAPRESAVIWRSVGSWSDRGNLQTGSFSVETGALRVKWETRNEAVPGAGRFKVSLHSAISGRPLQVAVDHRGPGRDTVYIEDEPRVSYLVVESADIDWSLSLEEAVPATADKSH